MLIELSKKIFVFHSVFTLKNFSHLNSFFRFSDIFFYHRLYFWVKKKHLYILTFFNFFVSYEQLNFIPKEILLWRWWCWISLFINFHFIIFSAQAKTFHSHQYTLLNGSWISCFSIREPFIICIYNIFFF